MHLKNKRVTKILVALVFFVLEHKIEPRGAGGGEKRQGLGPRNDVLTTCKAVTQRGDQRIITLFFPQ